MNTNGGRSMQCGVLPFMHQYDAYSRLPPDTADGYDGTSHPRYAELSWVS